MPAQRSKVHEAASGADHQCICPNIRHPPPAPGQRPSVRGDSAARSARPSPRRRSKGFNRRFAPVRLPDRMPRSSPASPATMPRRCLWPLSTGRAAISAVSLMLQGRRRRQGSGENSGPCRAALRSGALSDQAALSRGGRRLFVHRKQSAIIRSASAIGHTNCRCAQHTIRGGAVPS